ncbi:glycosyltransferase [Candidatus Uhrbacteria bacterium]|nr:glycosyltransferase [Candidatus Uhrbacteria bacterium]
MRFLFVNPLPFPTTRAYGIQLAKTADALIEAGHSVELWIPSYEAPYPGNRDVESLKKAYGVKHLPVLRTVDMGITPHRSFGVPILNALWFRFVVRQYAKQARRLLEKESGDSVIITRDPLIVHALRGISQKVFWELHTLGKISTQKKALVSADGILPISKSLESACVALGFPHHGSRILPSGVDVSLFSSAPTKEEARKKLGIDPSFVIFAFAGRFQEAWKGRDTLLGVASRLTGAERLYLVGDLGGGVDAFKKEAEKQRVNLDRVIFAGHVEPSSVPLYLAAADLFLLPNSAKEPIGREHTSPIKLFEYLAVGRPIVASDLPSVREVLDETNSSLFPADNPDACIAACRSIISDNSRAEEFVRAGKEKAAAYDWKSRANKLISFAEERVRDAKTVIVPIFDGAISKNIVDSGALQPLVDRGHRVLLWVYEAKADYYRKRYGPRGYEVAEYGEPRIPLWATMLQNFAIDCIPTYAIYLKHARRMVAKKKYVLGAVRIALWGLGHVAPIRFVFQRLALLWQVPLKIKSLVRIERPVLVFCPTMVWLAEVQLNRHAKNLGIPSIGMDKSWDNITSKLILPIKPDLLIVPNSRCQDEAVQYLGFPREKTRPVGLPQFDRYAEPGLMENREGFFKRMGLDPAKPMLLYCAAGLWMAKDEPDVLLWLDEQIEKGRFGPLQVLVRLHPKYDCGADKLTGTKHLVFDRPGTYVMKDLTQWEYEDHDLRHLISSIRFAAVTANTASTMSIEAAYFDRPVINIAIDPKPVPHIMSIERYYKREHYKPIIDAGGATLARTFEEFGAQIERYLKDPALDHEGRERVIREQCIDRQPIAAKRLADVLLSHLGYSS